MSFSSYISMQKQLEQAPRAFRQQHVDMCEQITRSLKPFQLRQLEFIRQIENQSALAARFQEITLANQQMVKLFDRARLNTEWIGGLQRIHQTWTKDVQPMQDRLARIQEMATLSLANVFRTLTISEDLFARIDVEKIQNAFTLPDESILRLQRVSENITGHFRDLVESVRTLPDLTSLPAFVVPGASREIFISGYVVASLVPEIEVDAGDDLDCLVQEAETETGDCLAILEGINPALARPLIGAKDALKSDSVDRTRHFLASLRELWNHLLRFLAPDDNVFGWMPKKGSEYIYDGKPTRKARVLYICRGINHDPLSSFVAKDTQALVEMIKFFNHVHELEHRLSQHQLEALMLRTECWLSYLLKIWEDCHGR